MTHVLRICGLTWEKNSTSTLRIMLIVFLGSGFFLSPEPVWADIFYIGVLPLALYKGWMNRRSFSLSRMPILMMSAWSLVLWFEVSLFWDHIAWHRPSMFALWTLNVICTLVFIQVLYVTCNGSPAFRRCVVATFIACGFLNIIISLVRLPIYHPDVWSNSQLRMSGWAETRHPILGAALVGVVVLFCVMRAVQTKAVRHWCCAGLGLLFIGLTGSRGPELAIAIAVVSLLGIGQPKTLVMLFFAGSIIVSVDTLFDWPGIHHIVSGQMARGDSHRFSIWIQSWHDILKRPLLGYGPNYSLARDAHESFPHSLFLSTWLYSGIVGLGLLTVYLSAIVLHVASIRRKIDLALGAALVIEVLVNAVTDFGQVVRGPSMMWYVFWFPTLFAASYNDKIGDQNRNVTVVEN